MQTYRTQTCGSHGHPEVTIQMAAPSPIPNVHRFLVDYFETAVARGVKFLPGQTVRIGWAVLRLCERADGTLGVEERALTPEVQWTEQVDRALHDTWSQREIAASLGLLEQLTFPGQDQAAMVRECGMEARRTVLLRLPAETLSDSFSGWTLSCMEDHDHGEPAMLPLLAIAAHQPGLVQLLALPPETTVLVVYREKPGAPAGFVRIEPHVYRESAEMKPTPGSYLAMLQG